MTRLGVQAVEQSGQQRGSCPIVGHSVAIFCDMVGMRANYNCVLRFARQHADDVRRKLPVEGLFPEIRALAARFRQPLRINASRSLFLVEKDLKCVAMTSSVCKRKEICWADVQRVQPMTITAR